jgi:hypothetical protein
VPGHGEGGRRYCEAFAVPVTSLDAICGRPGRPRIPRLRLVKVDVEGEEAPVVRGMRRTLWRAGRPPVWCEVRGPTGSRRAPGTFAAVLAELRALGYLPFRFAGTAGLRPLLEEDLRRGRSDDVLFAHWPPCS